MADREEPLDDSPVGPVRHRRAVTAWTALIVVASLVDPGTVLDPLGVPPAAGSGAAGGGAVFAAAHLVAYGVLAWLLVGGGAPTDRGPRAVLVAVVAAGAVGVGVELLQAPVAARTASAADALLNTVGAAIGAGVRAVFGSR